MPTFPHATLSFLADLEAHNNKPWFDANRSRYESDYVAVGKAFHEALSAEVKLPGKVMRIFRDVRFSKDKTPYKAHLDLWFAEAQGWGPGLFVRLRPTTFLVGMGCHEFDKAQLAKFRAGLVADAAGLKAAMAGLHVGGKTLKRFPAGFPQDNLFLHTALHVQSEGPVPDDAVAHTVKEIRRFSPVYDWLKRHLA
jgi:uncharacterized protein (TIGR02453 family)